MALCGVIVLVVVLLPVMVVTPVCVFMVCVVITVRVPRVTVGIAHTGVMSAPLPSVGNWNTDVDRLGLWETHRERVHVWINTHTQGLTATPAGTRWYCQRDLRFFIPHGFTFFLTFIIIVVSVTSTSPLLPVMLIHPETDVRGNI